jgi:hypothetical protein
VGVIPIPFKMNSASECPIGLKSAEVRVSAPSSCLSSSVVSGESEPARPLVRGGR